MRTFEVTYVHLSNERVKYKLYISAISFSSTERKVINYLRKNNIIIHKDSIIIKSIINLGKTI